MRGPERAARRGVRREIVREELSVRPGPDGEPVYELGEPLEDHGPTLNAIRTLVRISERRSRLLGLDAPVSVELDGQLRVIVEGIAIEAITGQPAELEPNGDRLTNETG